MKTLQYSLLSILVTLCGCDSSPTIQATRTVVEPPLPPLIDVTPLTAGPRPKAILDAEVCDTHVFHQNPGMEGRWVCLEGTVIQTGRIDIMPYVFLKCPSCDVTIDCYGFALEKYRVPLNSNAMIRGRYVWGRVLDDVDLVTQQTIDRALQAQTESTDR